MEINKQIELLNNICPLGKGYHNSKREHRLKFFEDIQTEIQAYLLGFYVADGSLNEERHTIRIKIKNTDSEILDLYSNYICPDARRVIFPETSMIGPKGKEIHISEVGQVDITGKIICDALVSYGYGPRKTYQELHLPKLSDELLWHFIRGYFDGDGCITGSISEPNKKNREINPRLKLRAE